jgi:hypothetical protein
MIYLTQLQRMTPANIKRNSRYVLLFSGSTFIERDQKGRHKVYRARAKTTRGRARDPKRKSGAKVKLSGDTYELVIKMYGKPMKDGTMKPNNRAWVHCTCPYFLYYNEVALAARGSSEVISSNGALPNIRNPRMKPYLCKHLFRAATVAPKAKAKEREDLTKIDEADLDRMLEVLAPYIPGSERGPSRLGKRTPTRPGATKPKRGPPPVPRRRLPRRVGGPGYEPA